MATNVSRFDSSSCSNEVSAMSNDAHISMVSIMKGLPFGGMPVVFLLNLSVVLVSVYVCVCVSLC